MTHLWKGAEREQAPSALSRAPATVNPRPGLAPRQSTLDTQTHLRGSDIRPSHLSPLSRLSARIVQVT